MTLKTRLLAVAAAGPRGMRVAAAHGASWVTYGDLSGAEHVDPIAGSRIVADQVKRLERIEVWYEALAFFNL